SFVWIKAPVESRSSSVGSANLSGKVSEGPRARTTTVFAWVPVMMNPPISALSSVRTPRRDEMLASTVGGVAVGLALGVGVAVGVLVGVAVADAVAVAVAVAVGVGVAVAVAVAVGVGVGDAEALNAARTSTRP